MAEPNIPFAPPFEAEPIASIRIEEPKIPVASFRIEEPKIPVASFRADAYEPVKAEHQDVDSIEAIRKFRETADTPLPKEHSIDELIKERDRLRGKFHDKAWWQPRKRKARSAFLGHADEQEANLKAALRHFYFKKSKCLAMRVTDLALNACDKALVEASKDVGSQRRKVEDILRDPDPSRRSHKRQKDTSDSEVDGPKRKRAHIVEDEELSPPKREENCKRDKENGACKRRKPAHKHSDEDSEEELSYVSKPKRGTPSKSSANESDEDSKSDDDSDDGDYAIARKKEKQLNVMAEHDLS